MIVVQDLEQTTHFNFLFVLYLGTVYFTALSHMRTISSKSLQGDSFKTWRHLQVESRRLRRCTLMRRPRCRGRTEHRRRRRTLVQVRVRSWSKTRRSTRRRSLLLHSLISQLSSSDISHQTKPNRSWCSAFIYLFIHYATEAAHTHKIKHKVKTQSIKNSKNTTQRKS